MVSSRSSRRRDLAIAICAPVVLLAFVYGLWAAIDVVGQVGPFDKAKLGWATVMPVWFASPALAALMWRRLPSVEVRRVAGVVGLLLGAAATWILWSAVVTENAACDFGPRSSPSEFLPPAALIGIIVGGGWGFTALMSASLVSEGRPWRALAVAILIGLVQFGLVAITFTFIVFGYAGCNRPA